MTIRLFACQERRPLKCGFEKFLVALSFFTFLVLLVLSVRGCRRDRNERRSRYRTLVHVLCMVLELLVIVHYAFVTGDATSDLAMMQEICRSLTYLVIYF